MPPPYDQFNAAMIHTEMAGLALRPDSGVSAMEGRAEADRAMTWFRRAIDGGYRPLTQILAEPVLNPLRSRPDFRLLVMDLAFPKDPFARDRSVPRPPLARVSPRLLKTRPLVTDTRYNVLVEEEDRVHDAKATEPYRCRLLLA